MKWRCVCVWDPKVTRPDWDMARTWSQDMNPSAFDAIFSKQVQALGSPGDVLLGFSTSGNSANVIAAIEAARAKDMTIIALTGRKGGRIREILTETDVHICVPHDRTARIQEVHLLVLHCLCDAVDLQLLGEQENT